MYQYRCLFEDSTKVDVLPEVQALASAKECYAMKSKLLTNATVVDDAIKFVAAHTGSINRQSQF